MKRIYILIILLAGLANMSLFAQEEPKIEKLEINGRVYNYQSTKGREISSADNKIKINKICDTFQLGENSISYFREAVKKVFSKERIQELAKNPNNMTLVLYCNRKGNVLEIKFITHRLSITEKGGKDSLSLKEIDSLNTELKKCIVNMRSTCPDVKYYAVGAGIKFTDPQWIDD